MDEDLNVKEDSPDSKSHSTGAASNDEEDTFENDDTFETIAYGTPRARSSRATAAPGSRLSGLAGTSSAAQPPLNPGHFSGGGISPSRLGRSATYCPSQAAAMSRYSSADDGVMAYKQKYARMDMRKVSFMTRFRSTAQQLDREPSAWVDSSTFVKVESVNSDAGEGSPMKASASAPVNSAALSEMSQPQQLMQGAMGSALKHVRSKAGTLKRKEQQAGSFAFARLMVEVAFTAVASVAAIAVAVHDAHHPGFARLWNIPLLSWLILAALLCPTVRVGDVAVDAVVKGLEAAATRLNLENVHYTLIGLSDALKLLAAMLLLETLVIFVITAHDDPNTQKDNHTLVLVKRISLCCVVFAIVELTKTLGCRLLSLRVNAEALFDLLKTTIQKEAILNNVMTRARTASNCGPGNLVGGVTEAERLEAIAKLREIPDWSVRQYLDNLYEMSLPVDDNVVSSFTDRITDLVTQFRNMPEPQLDEHATCAAEFCWLTVAPAANICSERMFKEDLSVLLQSDEEADLAFSLFDVDGDGYVTEPEVHSRIKAMYRERRNLARTLRDNDDVIHTLELLIGAIMHVIAIVPYLLIFGLGQNISHMLLSLSSVSVASAFVFGNSLKTIYESVVFLFVIRPYQVGDAITYKDALHVVKNFGLLSTQFLRYDGCKVWVPNETLMQADILNITRSRHLIDRLSIEVDIPNMTPELCYDLAERVAAMIAQEEPRRLFNDEFTPASYILGVSTPLKYSVGLTYQLAFNGEQFARVVEARTLVNHVIGTWLLHHKLSHSTSVQPLYSFTPTSAAKPARKTA